MRWPTLLGLAVLSGCGAAGPPAATQMVDQTWQTEVYREHPLVGRIWSTRDGRFVDEAELITGLRPARYVLIGEQHDHPDHHRLQARILKALAGQPVEAVAFEMLDEADQAGVRTAADAATLARDVNWSASGWPDFALYRPIFDVIYRAGLGIRVAHPTRDTLRRVYTDGVGQWPRTRVVRLGLDVPFPAALQADLEAQIRREHCGYAPEKIVKPMALAQNVKDAWMARALVDAGVNGGRALIAGNGHIRRDRGVPLFLARHDQSPQRAVALLAVQADGTAVADYHPERYDYLIFTPRVDAIDPCVRFKQQLEQMRKRRR